MAIRTLRQIFSYILWRSFVGSLRTLSPIFPALHNGNRVVEIALDQDTTVSGELARPSTASYVVKPVKVALFSRSLACAGAVISLVTWLWGAGWLYPDAEVLTSSVRVTEDDSSPDHPPPN